MNGSLFAEYTPGWWLMPNTSNTYFIFQDHLGSTRTVTNVSGTVVDSMDYAPFGEQIGGSSSTTRKFTGYERDSESNLDNAQARYFRSAQGRFMSPDPLGDSVGDPQSLNLYAYVRNNPLTLTDPSGMQPDDECEFAEDCTAIDINIPIQIGNPYPPKAPVYVPGSGTKTNPPRRAPPIRRVILSPARRLGFRMAFSFL